MTKKRQKCYTDLELLATYKQQVKKKKIKEYE